jgi:hypothetical protein
MHPIVSAGVTTRAKSTLRRCDNKATASQLGSHQAVVTHVDGALHRQRPDQLLSLREALTTPILALPLVYPIACVCTLARHNRRRYCFRLYVPQEDLTLDQ